MALIANAALLLNMARRLTFAIAQSITIVGWLVASFLLIALVSVASTDSFRLEPRERHTLTQAYYYAIIAAGLYFIVAILMVWTVFGAYRGHYEKEFRLTLVQRTLMLQTIMFLGYLLLGACVYSYVEDWLFLDAVYWADFTLLTIGIGSDFVPKTHLGRSLLFPYAVGGIVTVGLVIGSIRALVLERGKVKMTARMTEKKREKVLDSANLEKSTIKVNFYNTVSFSQDGLSEAERREQEFHIMRKIQEDAASHRKWMALGMSTLAAMTLWFIGALIFYFAERKQNWSYFVSLYFAYTSLLTIGYGDLQPTSNSAKPVFVVWSLLAIPTLTVLISNMGDTVVKSIADFVNWTGSLTILPGENGPKAAWRSAVQALGKRLPGSFATQFPGKSTPKSDNDESWRHGSETVEQHLIERLTSHIEDEQLAEAREAGKHGDTTERDHHLYLYVLSKELRQLMKDVQESPPKKYSYHDWAWYLKLLGQDENDRSKHRSPPIEPEQKRRDAEGEREHLGLGGGKKGNLTWSWLGTPSPLMGSKNEADWLLENMSAALERELYELHSNKKTKRKSPISFDDVAKKADEDTSGDAHGIKEAKKAANGEEGSEEGATGTTSTGSEDGSSDSDTENEQSHHDTDGVREHERDERSMHWE